MRVGTCGQDYLQIVYKVTHGQYIFESAMHARGSLAATLQEDSKEIRGEIKLFQLFFLHLPAQQGSLRKLGAHRPAHQVQALRRETSGKSLLVIFMSGGKGSIGAAFSEPRGVNVLRIRKEHN